MTSWACWISRSSLPQWLSQWVMLIPCGNTLLYGWQFVVFPAYINCIRKKWPVEVTFKVPVISFPFLLPFTGTDLARSNSRVQFPTVMYEQGVRSRFKTRSFGMLCHLIKAWVFHWNINCSSLSNPRTIEIFDAVAIRRTICLSDRVITFKTFRDELTVNIKCPPCSTNMALSFAKTIPFAMALTTLLPMSAHLIHKNLIVWIVFFIISSRRSLGWPGFFVFKMVTSLQGDSFGFKYAFLKSVFWYLNACTGSIMINFYYLFWRIFWVFGIS